MLNFPRKETTMRWTACCVLAVGLGVGIGAVMTGHFASKQSDPHLAELGLAENLDELAAPGDPEPAHGNGPIAGSATPSNDVIDLFAKPLNPAVGDTTTTIDSDIKPTSYLDTAGVIELDNLAHQWMPLCDESASGPNAPRSDSRDTGPERMPRCEESLSPRPLERPERQR